MTARTGEDNRGDLAEANAETITRVPVVAGWIVDGNDRASMYVMAREAWGIAPRSVDRLIQQARRELVAGWHVQREELLAVLLARSEKVFAASMTSGNHGAAIAAINVLSRLARLE
jgi:hypothetical protein